MSGNRPLKVLQIISSLGMGGAETWLMEVLRLWAKDGCVCMDFLATSGREGLFDAEARSLGASVFYIPYQRARLFEFAASFRRLLRGRQYDAVHDHQDYVSGWHYMLGAGVLPPVRVTHVHNPSYQILNNYGVTLPRRITARVGKSLVSRYSTHITGTSRELIEEYGFNASPFRAISRAALYCGFDPARFLGDPALEKASVCAEFGWPRGAKIILFAGRIDQSAEPGHRNNHKNSAFAVTAGIECARLDPSVHVLFVGALSPAVPILQQRASASGFAGRIHFAGIRSDIARLMLASDVLLFPSRGEGLGMVSVEAQAAGLPVLASEAVPAECVVVPELVRFQRLGAEPSRWARDLFALIAQPRDVLKANRMVAASEFAIQHSARSLLNLYSAEAFPSGSVKSKRREDLVAQ